MLVLVFFNIQKTLIFEAIFYVRHYKRIMMEEKEKFRGYMYAVGHPFFRFLGGLNLQIRHTYFRT